MTASRAQYDAALAHARARRFAESAAALQVFLTEAPDDLAAWRLLAVVRQRLGQTGAAIACYAEVLRLAPGDADAHVAQGNLFASLGQRAQALASFDRAAALTPASPFVQSNRANMLNKLGRHAEALAAADFALSHDPSLTHAWRHRGVALACLGDAEGAVEAYRVAVARAGPAEAPEALSDLGYALANVGRYEEAEASLDRAIALQPDLGSATFRRGELRLLRGDYDRGWVDYEARWKLPDVLQATRELTPALLDRLVFAPRADDLAGRRVLVVSEQGFGDEIMFASVLPDLATIAEHVTCIVSPRLVRLLARSLPQVSFVGAGSSGHVDAAAFDAVVALGSLGHVFRRALAEFPGAAYLAPAPHIVEQWRHRLPASSRLRVGLSWRGGVSRTRAMARSMDLAMLLPLLARDDCTFVSLQYGDVAEEIADANRRLPRPIVSYPPADTHDFEDLAGLVAALDIVVTVQTTVAHLAGAIGQRGLVMLSRWPEWRYGLQGEDIAWYRSLRLLRQAQPGSWASVLDEVDQRLSRA